jgi:hypothetical protein
MYPCCVFGPSSSSSRYLSSVLISDEWDCREATVLKSRSPLIPLVEHPLLHYWLRVVVLPAKPISAVASLA